MRLIKLIILLFILSLHHPSIAQYYSTGSDPANIKWRQVNSPFFKVVYPDDFEPDAKRFIAILDSLYLFGGYTLHHTPKPIPVLIHSHSAYSNGLVTWAPKRMEIYPTPSQSTFAQDYLEQLAIHEFRHVVQIDKIDKGFSHILSYPFGQQAIGGILGLYVPLWFLEGDATLSETTLSKSGRGRVPSFEQEIRAQLLEKDIYSYEKAYFGSYKDYIPNHYMMGYLFTAGARHKYGSEVWEKALDETGRKSWSIIPFNNGIKSITGKNKVPLYHETFADWQQRWINQDNNLTLSKVEIVSSRDKHYKDYSYPVAFDDQHILAEVSGPGEVRYFAKVNVETGNEVKILTIGYKDREPFSYANNIICWTELEQHPRWENQFFSVIRTYNFKTHKQKKLSSKSRYFAPAISPDGKKVAAVYISTSNDKAIHILDADDGKLQKTIPSPDNQLPITPSWNNDGNELVMVLLTPMGKKLSLLNTNTNKWTDLTQPEYSEIVSPQFIDDQIYFSGSWSGIDNIYRINKDGSELQKVTESRFGATQVSKGTKAGTIVYQDYTSDGYQIALASLDSIYISDYTPGPLPIEPFIQQLQEQEKGLPNLKNLPVDGYQSKKYSKWNLFNLHSWAPVNINMNDATVTQGISLMSQNLLSSTFTSIGYNADKQYTREKYYFNISHRAWWPIFELEVKAGNEKYYDDGYYANTTDTFKLDADVNQEHIYAHLEINLPLNLTRGKWQRIIQPSISSSYQYASAYFYTRTYITKVDNQWVTKETEKIDVDATHSQPINYGLFMYNIHNRSQRDVSSRWGQLIELSYRHTPIGGIDLGSIIGIHTRLYFPGLMQHHSIRLDNDWHKKDRGEQYFSNETRKYYRYFNDFVRFPRGITPFQNDELYSFKGDYIFPLINPDWNLPGVIFLKRITTNLFFDYSLSSMHIQDSDTNNWTKYKDEYYSFGSEFRAELHPLRFVFPISVGYRYAYLPKTNNHYNEFLLGIGFTGFSLGKN